MPLHCLYVNLHDVIYISMLKVKLKQDFIWYIMSQHNETVKRQFPVTGMGCAACATRIETTLNKQPGVVQGSVNYATQTASVEYIPDIVQPDQLQQSIQSIGYDLIIENGEAMKDELEDRQKKNLNH